MKKIYLSLFFILLFLSPYFFVSAGGISPTSQLEAIFSRIGNWLYSFLIAGAIIGIVIGAFMILLSGGDPGKANTGKMIIIYALIAVIIGVFARGLVGAVRGLVP